MAEQIVLVDSLAGWPEQLPELQVVPVRSYLTDPAWSERRGVRAVNLCRDMHYHSAGYYASLLAEARGHRVLPSVRTIQDLSRKALYLDGVEQLDRRTQAALQRIAQNAPGSGGAIGGVREGEGQGQAELEVFLVFGESEDPDLQSLSRTLFEAFPAPLLRVEFRRRGEWRIASIRTAGLARLPSAMQPSSPRCSAAAFDAGGDGPALPPPVGGRSRCCTTPKRSSLPPIDGLSRPSFEPHGRRG